LVVELPLLGDECLDPFLKGIEPFLKGTEPYGQLQQFFTQYLDPHRVLPLGVFRQGPQEVFLAVDGGHAVHLGIL
jgi:hypothetical protein